ncbi:hypothetical protein SCALM49S_04196 [Streptomyces californicus]
MATDLHRPVKNSRPPSASRISDAPDTVVRVEGLTRSFDGHAVIDDLDLSLRAGEFTALLGRSGCGKSTLLRVLAGLDREISGTVLVPRRRAVAFQAPRLMPWKRVWRNVLLGLPGKPERPVAERALAEVGLAGRAGRGRRPCPAARPSAPRWPGPWCASPICCCSTSPSARWTP